MFSMVFAWTSCWTDSPVAIGLRRRDMQRHYEVKHVYYNPHGLWLAYWYEIGVIFFIYKAYFQKK